MPRRTRVNAGRAPPRPGSCLRLRWASGRQRVDGPDGGLPASLQSGVIDRDQAAALDARDPLLEFRQLFELPEDIIYLDGNSLGPLPVATRERVHEVVESAWGSRLIRAWDEGWLDLPVTVGDRLGALLGAAPGQV